MIPINFLSEYAHLQSDNRGTEVSIATIDDIKFLFASFNQVRGPSTGPGTRKLVTVCATEARVGSRYAHVRDRADRGFVLEGKDAP
jgi:hypothetical protein